MKIMGVINFYPNPTLRTIRAAKTIYDRKQAGEKLLHLSRELGQTMLTTSRLYNWYKDWYITGKMDETEAKK